MNTVMCNVTGIVNKENKTQIKNALDKVEGVQKVGVNLSTGTVEVQFNPPATQRQIRGCIENTGFKVAYQ